MNLIRKALCIILPALFLVQPVLAQEETAAAATEPDIVTALYPMDTLPGNWSPLSKQSPEKQWLQELTTAPLYALDDAGSWQPVLAEELPEDVTAEFTGDSLYGIPADAARGYAFRIRLNQDARWDNGIRITSDDYLFSIKQLLMRKDTAQNWTFLANAASILSGKQRPTGAILSLRDAGFSSVQEARKAGFTDFYVDTASFWGLDGGWKSLSDRVRLRDYAMPGGLNEFFVTPAYLYNRYLIDGAENSRFQSEFVGICQQYGDTLTMEDLGIRKVSSQEFIIITQMPTTVSSLILQLNQLPLFCEDHFGDSYATSANTYCSSGPWCIRSADAAQILLEPNPYWCGKADARGYDRILCIAAGKD